MTLSKLIRAQEGVPTQKWLPVAKEENIWFLGVTIFSILGHNLLYFGMHGQSAEPRGDNTS